MASIAGLGASWVSKERSTFDSPAACVATSAVAMPSAGGGGNTLVFEGCAGAFVLGAWPVATGRKRMAARTTTAVPRIESRNLCSSFMWNRTALSGYAYEEQRNLTLVPVSPQQLVSTSTRRRETRETKKGRT